MYKIQEITDKWRRKNYESNMIFLLLDIKINSVSK
jgi:hypothetical protein